MAATVTGWTQVVTVIVVCGRVAVIRIRVGTKRHLLAAVRRSLAVVNISLVDWSKQIMIYTLMLLK